MTRLLLALRRAGPFGEEESRAHNHRHSNNAVDDHRPNSRAADSGRPSIPGRCMHCENVGPLLAMDEADNHESFDQCRHKQRIGAVLYGQSEVRTRRHTERGNRNPQHLWSRLSHAMLPPMKATTCFERWQRQSVRPCHCHPSIHDVPVQNSVLVRIAPLEPLRLYFAAHWTALIMIWRMFGSKKTGLVSWPGWK